MGSYSSTNDIQTTWSSNKLDGGTLQISANSHSSNHFILTMTTDSSVVTGQGYRLSFSVQGAIGRSYITVYLRNQDSPNQTISEQAPLGTQIKIPITTSQQDFTFGFIPVNFTRAGLINRVE